MSIFSTIGKGIKGVGKVAVGAVNVVAKPVAKAIKPITGIAGKLAAKATAGTPIGGAIAKIQKIDFTKNPVKALGQTYVENLKGSATLGKSLLVAKVGGAVSGAVSSATSGTPLAGIGSSVANTLGAAAQSTAAAALKVTTPGKSRGGSVYKTAGAAVKVSTTEQGFGGLAASLLNRKTATIGGATVGKIATAAGRAGWDQFAGAPETLGGVVDDGS